LDGDETNRADEGRRYGEGEGRWLDAECCGSREATGDWAGSGLARAFGEWGRAGCSGGAGGTEEVCESADK